MLNFPTREEKNKMWEALCWKEKGHQNYYGFQWMKIKKGKAICRKNSLILAPNKRHFVIRRLKNHILVKNITKLVDSLRMSKLKYGLQLCVQVRLSDEKRKSYNMKITQIAPKIFLNNDGQLQNKG